MQIEVRPVAVVLWTATACLLFSHALLMELQVVAEVYAAQAVVIKPHILLSLVLYKIVDPAQV